MLVSLGLLALLGLMLIGLFLRLHIGSTKTGDQQIALEIGERFLEEAAFAPPESWEETASQSLSVTDPVAKTEFTTRLRYLQVSASDNPLGDLYRLDAEISWWDPEQKTRRDYGQLKVSLSRFVYVNHSK